MMCLVSDSLVVFVFVMADCECGYLTTRFATLIGPTVRIFAIAATSREAQPFGAGRHQAGYPDKCGGHVRSCCHLLRVHLKPSP